MTPAQKIAKLATRTRFAQRGRPRDMGRIGFVLLVSSVAMFAILRGLALTFEIAQCSPDGNGRFHSRRYNLYE